jgi:hypothetical protein
MRQNDTVQGTFPAARTNKESITKKNGAPGKTRTPDPLLRRQLLYPPELQARGVIGL